MQQDNLILLDEFFSYIKKKCSPNTYLAYKQDISLYKEFVFHTGHQDIQEFYLFIKEKGLSPRTQARMMSCLKTYFKFLESHHQRIPDGMCLRPPYIKSDPPQALSPQSFKKLYKACQTSDTLKTLRNQITLLMLFDLGLRVTQLVNLNLKDFKEEQQVLRIFHPQSSKESMLPLSAPLLRELKFYLAKVRPHLNSDKSIDALLLNDRGKRPSRVDIWRWLTAWSKKAGLKNTVNPHQFRHGCVMALLKSGADLKSIQKLLGHRRIETTRMYEKFTLDDKGDRLKKVVKDHHPLSQISHFHPYRR